jgi:L,D-peptidoglycan transpeptidase YkuD (ErfK/YbiS/YcfS/YnhG family)
MPIDRRVLLTLPVMASAVAGLARAALAAVSQNLEYHEGRLKWPGGSARAAVGRTGVVVNKKEGDGATPAGTFPLVSGFYRPDRMAPLRSGLPVRALSPQDAWVDDPTDHNYNHLVSLPYPAHAEPMWLGDAVYDLLVVIGYNIDPVVPEAGSAIFLHIARPDFSPTAGCIAVEKDVLVRLMPLLGLGSTISVRG